MRILPLSGPERAPLSLAKPSFSGSNVAAQLGGRTIGLLGKVLVAQQRQRRHGRGRRQRIGVEGAGMGDLLLLPCRGRGVIDQVENLALAGDRAARQAARHDLGQDAEVGRDAHRLLRTARRPAETGDDLVHQHHDAAPCRDLAHLLGEARRQRHLAPRSARRFEHHRRDVVAALEQLHDRTDIVGGHQDRQVGHALGNARGRRAVIVRGGARGDVVVPAMEVADEADDLVLAGMGAGEADRHVRGFRARRGETDFLGRRDQLAHEFGPTHLELVAGTIVRPEIHLPLHGLDDGGMRMAEQHRAVTTEVIHVLVAIDVPFARPHGTRDVNRIRVEVARIVRDAARQHLACPFVEGRRASGAGLVVGHDGGVRLR